MTRQRLRPAHDAAALEELYGKPYDHTRWREHTLRIGVTSALARWLVVSLGLASAADLMCGDGAVLASLPIDDLTYGDLVPGRHVGGAVIAGPIEETARTMPSVDLVVLTEAIEHLDDPDLVLRLLRAKGRNLLLSTPVDCWGDDNPEHYWAWSRADVEGMLVAAGWGVQVYQELDQRPGGGPYSFGIWAAS